MTDALCSGKQGGAKEEGRTYLCVLYYQVTWGEDEGDERGGEEHLDNGDVAVIAAEYSGEGIGVIDAKALGGACKRARGGPESALD